MAGSEKAQVEMQRKATAAMAELHADWVNDAVRRLKRMTAAGTEMSGEITQLVNAELEAAIASQKQITKMTSAAIAANDPLAMMTLPHSFLHEIIRQGLESSVRNLQSAQFLFAQIHEVSVNDGDNESPKS